MTERTRAPSSRRALALGVAALLAGASAWLLLRSSPEAPVIGVSLDTSLLNRLGITRVVYDLAIARAGGRAVPLRPGPKAPEALVAGLDGLLLTGGGDVDPELYGEPDLTAQLVDRARDDFELALVRAALDRGVPILGICRGLQLLDVAFGGTLRSIRADEALDRVHGLRIDRVGGHEVRLRPGTRLAGILGRERLRVSSFHGQAVAKVGEGLVVAAEAPDGGVEALERPDGPLVLGVQWHPELALFRTLVDAAAARRGGVGARAAR